MKILGIVPARGGSKGILHKNIYPLCGEPLIEWTVKAINGSSLENYRITTDIPYILRTYSNAQNRPEQLCSDDAKTIDVIKFYADKTSFIDFDAFMILQPTSPLRTSEDINKAIDLFNDSEANCLYSGYYIGLKHKAKTYNKYTAEKHFQRNGAIFIIKRELIETGQLWDNTVIEYEMPLSRSIDIDTLDDMYIAEALLKNRIQGGQ